MPSEKKEVDAGKQIEEWKRGEREFPISRVPPRKGAAPKEAPPRKEPPRERSEPRGPVRIGGSTSRELNRMRELREKGGVKATRGKRKRGITTTKKR